MRDIDRPEYPMPCDPVSGMAWWRFNVTLCLLMPGYSEWQSAKRMSQLIPVLDWLFYGPIPHRPGDQP